MLTRHLGDTLLSASIAVGRQIDCKLRGEVGETQRKLDVFWACKEKDLQPRYALERHDGNPGDTPAPQILMQFPGIIIICKPTDWEMDGNSSAGEGKLRLSTFVQQNFSKDTHPLVYRPEFDYGFIHRLDIPSSGLALTGTLFQGLYSLRWQIDTYAIGREYLIAGHCLMNVRLRRIAASLADAGKRSLVTRIGKPSLTNVKCRAHKRGTEGRFTMIPIRLYTGRRHQIRSHVCFAGHATVTDARYAASSVVCRWLDAVVSMSRRSLQT